MHGRGEPTWAEDIPSPGFALEPKIFRSGATKSSMKMKVQRMPMLLLVLPHKIKTARTIGDDYAVFSGGFRVVGCNGGNGFHVGWEDVEGCWGGSSRVP